jgi:hypothetical protein
MPGQSCTQGVTLEHVNASSCKSLIIYNISDTFADVCRIQSNAYVK